MKRLIWIILVSIFVAGFSVSQAIAKQEKLPLTATASSAYSSYYDADKAVDGNDNTYWIGGRNAAPWWIMFDAGRVSRIDEINIKWWPSYYYVPEEYDIQISDDGVNWQNLYTGLQGSYDADGETREINRETRYIRFYIYSVYYYYPVLKEVTAFKEINVPHAVRFQGTLGDAEGMPLDGTFALTFRLYEAETGGSPIWEEMQEDVIVEEGRLDVELGSVVSIDLPFDMQYWLGVEVESDGEMTPRFKLTSVPYAIRSEE